MLRRVLTSSFILLLMACGQEPAPEVEGAADSAADAVAVVTPPDSYPARVPDDWDRDRLPPAALMTREGACPFECCQYGEWWSDSATVVLHAPRRTADTAFVLRARMPFTAQTGVVYVTSLARVVLEDTMDQAELGGPLTPADTFYLVEPIGEGWFIAWQDGRERELPGIWESYYRDSHAQLEGEYEREWWVRILTSEGRGGWVWMDRTSTPMWGSDACAAPAPEP